MLVLRLFGVVMVVVVWTGWRAVASGEPRVNRDDQRLACQACHQSGDPRSEAPHLAGQRRSYLAGQLKAFKSGQRRNAFMSAIAIQLNETDIDDLAAFWSKQPHAPGAAIPTRAAAIQRSRVRFPAEFPRGFVLYLTSNDSERKTVNRYYINQIGFAAARANRPLPDRTVVIVTHEAARLDSRGRPIAEPSGRWLIDRLEDYAIMETRTGWGDGIPALLRNDSWNYALFGPDRAPRADGNQAPCLACHKPQATVDYLFSFKELRDKAQ